MRVNGIGNTTRPDVPRRFQRPYLDPSGLLCHRQDPLLVLVVPRQGLPGDVSEEPARVSSGTISAGRERENGRTNVDVKALAARG